MTEPANPLDAATPEQLTELDGLTRMSRDEKILLRIDCLAGELGRLRSVLDLEPGSLAMRRLDRVCDHVDAIDALVHPCAAALIATIAPGADQAATEALDLVDRHTAHLRHRLGMKAAA